MGIEGHPGVQGPPGTPPDIPGRTADLATNIKGMGVYGNAMLSYLFAMLEWYEYCVYSEHYTGDKVEARKKMESYVSRVDDFVKHDYFDAMISYADSLATDKNNSQQDKKVYVELRDMFKKLGKFWP